MVEKHLWYPLLRMIIHQVATMPDVMCRLCRLQSAGFMYHLAVNLGMEKDFQSLMRGSVSDEMVWHFDQTDKEIRFWSKMEEILSEHCVD